MLQLLGESANVPLEVDELGEVVVVERVRLAHVPARLELVVPDLPGRSTLLEEEHDRLHARAEERAAGQVQHGVEVAALQQELAQADRGVVGVAQEGVLDDDGGATASLGAPDEVLEEEVRGLAGLDWEVLLDLRSLLAAERRIGQDDVVAVLLLDVGEVLGQRVGVEDVRGLDAVQDHVHDRDDVGEALLLLAVERARLERLEVGRRQAGLGAQVVERLAQEAG